MAVLSQTSEYALRATTLLAQRTSDTPVDVALLADALAVPRNYLSKTLSQLARAGVLESVRGKRGGFRLARPPAELTLFDVIEPFERLGDTSRCLLGQPVCSDRTACAAHEAWKKIGSRIIRFFRSTTLAELARGHTRWPNKAALSRLMDGRVAG
jgi:Rrf2 family protein